MANSLKILSICYFLVLFLSNSPLIHARESKFFSKFTHFTTLSNSQPETQPISEPPAFAPSLAPAPAPSKGDGTDVSFDAKGDETELFDEGETYQQGSQSSKNYYNNNEFSNEFGSQSHDTVNRHANYNYNSNTNNGYRLVSTSSSNENGYEPVSTSSSHETVANNEEKYHNGYTPSFSYNTNSNGDGNEIFSDNEEHEEKYEPLSTSSSHETVANNEEKYHNGHTPSFSYNANNFGNGNQLFSDEEENDNKQYEPVSTSSSRETVADNEEKYHSGYTPNVSYNTNNIGNGNELFSDEENYNKQYEPVSTSSSRETVANSEKKNYNGYKPNYSYNSNNIGEGNQLFSDEAEKGRQGMSDTRFVENGKYYYDVQKENENNYYPASGNNYDHNNQVNYNGNSRNEFNTVNFENQEVYEDNPEESLP